jgi:uncharacterized protein DUF6338
VTIDVVDAVLYLGPGFLALKLFHLFGAQRPRSEWEWTTWSVVVSIPLNAAATLVVANAPAPVAPLTSDAFHVTVAMALGLLSGLVAAIVWRKVRSSQRSEAIWLRRQVTDSAWDLALEDAQRADRGIGVETDTGERFRGKLWYGGREDAVASGWIYLRWPERFDDKQKKFVPTTSYGILLDRAKTKFVRVYLRPGEPQSSTAGVDPAEADPATPSSSQQPDGVTR